MVRAFPLFGRFLGPIISHFPPFYIDFFLRGSVLFLKNPHKEGRDLVDSTLL